MARVNFAIPGDFTSAGGVFPTPEKVDAEIRVDAALNAKFRGSIVTRTVYGCEFTAALTAGETATLNAVIAAHVPDTADDARDRELEAELTIRIDGLWDATAFDQENRIRMLEGLAPLSARDFRALLNTRYRVLP